MNDYLLNPGDIAKIALISFAAVWIINRVLSKYDPSMKA